MFEPRAWQDEFVVKYEKLDKKYFQAVASVGAGKTSAVCHLLSVKPDTLLLVFAPKLIIRRSWRNTPPKHGFNLFEGYEPGVDAKIGLDRDYRGLVATYPALASSPLVFRHLVSRNPNVQWLIAFDENHHLSERGFWGAAAVEAFDGLDNVKMLGLSGTPFRTDCLPIPFAEYATNNEIVVDYKYLYRDAVHDRVVRPIEFKAIDAQAMIVGPDGFKTLAIEDARDREIPQVIRSAIDHQSDWLVKAISLGWEFVLEDRKRIPNAALVIHTHNIFAAERVSKVAKEVTGRDVVVVTSGDNEDAVTQLEAFRASAAPILVVVAMASEGTDIDRLTVGIHATNVRTRLDFEQRFGRQVRLTSNEKGANGAPNRPITARYIIPAAQPHLQFAKEIYDEVKATLKDETEPGEGGGGGWDGELPPVLPAYDAELRHTFVGGERIADDEAWQKASDIAARFNIDQMEVYRTLVNHTYPRSEEEAPAEEPLQVKEKLLRDRLNDRVRAIAIHNFEGNYKAAYGWLNNALGTRKRVPTWSLAELRRGLDFLGLPDE
jgi:superfamily II DNA or RNA helicase